MTKSSKIYELRIEGHLNPSIFTTEWYSRNFEGLEAKGSFSTGHSFATFGALTINCDYDSWVADFTKAEDCEEAISVANRIFTELLGHTPVTMAVLSVFTKSQNEVWNSNELMASGLFANGLIESAPNSGDLFAQWRESDSPTTTVRCWTCHIPTHLHVSHAFEFPLVAGQSIEAAVVGHEQLFLRASSSNDRILRKILKEGN